MTSETESVATSDSWYIAKSAEYLMQPPLPGPSNTHNSYIKGNKYMLTAK